MKWFLLTSLMLVLICAQTGFSQFMAGPPLWNGLLPGPAQYSSPQNGGARAFSMGGVYTPTNLGVEALNGNPAGIAFTKGVELAVTSRLRIMGKDDFDESAYADLEGVDYESKFGINPKLLNLSAAYPFIRNRISVVGAAGYRSVYDISYKETASLDETGIISQDVTRRIHGLINTLSFGVGASFSNKYAVGVSYNIPIMSGYKENETSKERDLTENLTANTTLDIQSKISQGNFLQFGGMFHVISGLMVGASYTTGYEFRIKDLSYKLQADGESALDQKYEDYKKISVPGIWSIGASYKIMSKLLFAAEMQNRPWKNYEIDGYQFSNLKNGSAYRAGLEYGTGLLVRAGFGVERLPVTDKNQDPVDINSITCGAGYQWDKFTFDLGAAYRFVTFESAGSLMNKIFDIEGDYKIAELIVYATVKMGL